MTQEEKQLLLKDLCARLAHGITYYYDTDNVVIPKQILGLTEINNILLGIGDNIKPYLRPMSSMTDEEKDELSCYENCIQRVDFYYSHHIDCRFMIEKGLAIEAEEGMYKIK